MKTTLGRPAGGKFANRASRRGGGKPEPLGGHAPPRSTARLGMDVLRAGTSWQDKRFWDQPHIAQSRRLHQGHRPMLKHLLEVGAGGGI
jgi:hypothetical protein